MESTIIAGCCFVFLMIITVIFFAKPKIKKMENKVFAWLLALNIIGLILQFISYLLVNAFENFYTTTYYIFIIRLIFCYYVLWEVFFVYYIAIISFSLNDKNNKQKFQKGISILFAIGVIIATQTLILPINIKEINNLYYPSGPAMMFLVLGVLYGIVIIFYCLIKNLKHIIDVRYLPLLFYIIFGTLAIIWQMSNPKFLLITPIESLVLFLMYFTIENPDLKMLEEIHNAKVISDNANYEKTMFLYDMTNEIRGITKEINSETNDILTETKNEEVNIENINESARNIKSSTGKFTALTNEILDIDRIDSASIKVYNEKYSIKLILKELVSTYKKKCNGKGIDFRTSIVSDLPEYLYGDAIGFKNVLISLLDNSIKYTNKGYIELNVNMIKKQDICRLIITIEDSGVGIKSNDLEKIFKKDTEYFNYNRSNLKNNLYNAKKLITLMGGTIIATSTYGKGTNMKIVLDQKEVIMEKNDYTKVYDKKKILLVDEGEYTEKILRKYLHNTGVEIDSVKLGKNCLDKIRDKERYDLILIDENISPISSIELMHKLKEVRNFNIPCILLTRNYGIEYSCYYVDQGFSDYLFKPIDKNALLNKINKF